MVIPYSQKIWWGIKIWWFGGLSCNRQIKIRQYFILAYIHMAIPYRTTKFKSANIFTMAIWGPTAKFNSRQYFWLYGMHNTCTCSNNFYWIHTYWIHTYCTYLLDTYLLDTYLLYILIVLIVHTYNTIQYICTCK